MRSTPSEHEFEQSASFAERHSMAIERYQMRYKITG